MSEVRGGLLLIQVVFTQKVQMKRSITGGEADGCCPQRKSNCYSDFLLQNHVIENNQPRS